MKADTIQVDEYDLCEPHLSESERPAHCMSGEAVRDNAIKGLLAKLGTDILYSTPNELAIDAPSDCLNVAASYSKAIRNNRAACAVATKVLP